MDEMGLAIRDHKAVARNASFANTWVLTPEDLVWLRPWVDSYEPQSFVLGQPNSVSGELAQAAAKLAQDLEKALRIPVELVDETLSSWQTRGDDSKAAALLLESIQLRVQNKNQP